MAKDVYAKDVEYLTKHPGKIFDAWTFDYKHSSLFDICAPQRFGSTNHGCLTQVKCGYIKAFNKKLTEAIRNDPGIPGDPDSVKAEHLPRFAYWQRKMDKLWKSRGKPKSMCKQ